MDGVSSVTNQDDSISMPYLTGDISDAVEKQLIIRSVKQCW
jgi:hypothetical protein